MNIKTMICLGCVTASLSLLQGCDKHDSDNPDAKNPRLWNSPINNPDKPKTDSDYDGKMDPPEPAAPAKQQ